MKQKLLFIFLIALLIIPAINLFSQTIINDELLTPSNLYEGTYGLIYSDWDRIYFPSKSNELDRSFIYVPLSGSEIFSNGHYTIGSSFVIGPFRAFVLGDAYIDLNKYKTENQSYTYQDTLYQDSDGDGVVDVYRYTYENSYNYDKNSYNKSLIFLSPGISLTIGPLTGGARYIFKMFNFGNINYKYTYKAVTTDASYTSNNTSITADDSYSLTIKNSGMINGLAAGANIDLGFLKIHGDLFATFQNIGVYNLSTTENSYNLDANGLPINGTNVDYLVRSTNWTVQNGYLNFTSLNSGSSIFNYNTSTRFEYEPNDPSGIFSTSYPFSGTTTIHMPQLVTDTYIIAEGELFNFVVPLYLKFRSSSLTKDSFVVIYEDTQYAAQDQESQHTKITETLSLNSDGNYEFIGGTGIIKRFTIDSVSFQVGLKYMINPRKYNIKITRKIENIQQIDANSDGDYADAGDTNNTTVSEGWYKMYDYNALVNYINFPVSFIFNITKNFQFFGGAEFSYYFGNSRDGYLDAGSYNSVITTNNNTSVQTVTQDNYTTEPVMQYTKQSIQGASINYSFGILYYFTENLIFTTQLLSDQPTIFGSIGPTSTDLFTIKLIAEIEYKFGKK